MNKIKCFKVLPICMFTMLAACQSADTSEGTVQKYMEALSSGNSQLALEYQCLTDSKLTTVPTEIKSWEVLNQEPKIDDKDPDAKYNLVSVRIESMSMGNFPVTRTWKFDVWKSDDLFEFQKRFADKYNRLLKNGHELLTRTAEKLEIFGVQTAPITPAPVVIPDRKDITSKPYCITGTEPSESY